MTDMALTFTDSSTGHLTFDHRTHDVNVALSQGHDFYTTSLVVLVCPACTLLWSCNARVTLLLLYWSGDRAACPGGQEPGPCSRGHNDGRLHKNPAYLHHGDSRHDQPCPLSQ